MLYHFIFTAFTELLAIGRRSLVSLPNSSNTGILSEPLGVRFSHRVDVGKGCVFYQVTCSRFKKFNSEVPKTAVPFDTGNITQSIKRVSF